MDTLRRSVGWAVLTVVVAAQLLAVVHPSARAATVERLEHGLIQAFFSIRGPVRPPDGVVVVPMDDAARQQLRVPMVGAWPRGLHADLIDRLREAHARRIVFDVYFDEAGNPAVDDRLGAALAASGGIVGIAPQISDYAQYRLVGIPASALPHVASQQQAVLALPATDGQVWSLPSLDLEHRTLAQAAAGVSGATLPAGRALLWYYGPLTSLRVPYKDVLNRSPAATSLVADRVVFVGDTSTSGDVCPTPIGPLPGVDVHATATLNLLNGDHVRRVDAGLDRVVNLALIAVCVLFALVAHRGGLPLSLTVMGSVVVAVVVFLATATLAFFTREWLVPGSWVVLVGIPSIVAASVAQRRIDGPHLAFISYRRQTSGAVADSIYAGLKARRCRPFMDVRDREDGRFREWLLDMIERTPVFVLVLSSDCLKRCADPDDWVAREIAAALDTKRRVILAIVENCDVRIETAWLPARLRTIGDFNTVNYYRTQPDACLDEIARLIHRRQ